MGILHRLAEKGSKWAGHYMAREWTRHVWTNVDLQRRILATRESAAYAEERMSNTRSFGNRFDLMEFASGRMRKDGLVLELGVAGGGSINFLADRSTGRTVHGFDTFEGLPEDWRTGYGAGTYRVPDWKRLDVRRNVELHAGLFEQTLPVFRKGNGGPVAFMHVDCDLYTSTRTAFAFLEDGITTGTVIQFDEYFNYPGWKNHEFRAFQEFCRDRKLKYDYLGYVGKGSQVAVIIG